MRLTNAHEVGRFLRDRWKCPPASPRFHAVTRSIFPQRSHKYIAVGPSVLYAYAFPHEGNSWFVWT